MTDARWEELLALGADTLAAVCFFWIYKREEAEFRRVKDAPDITVGSQLHDVLSKCPESNLAYATVTGYTAAQDLPLKSHYDSSEMGVVQRITMLEHRTKRIQGYWSDSDRTIRNNLNIVPFEIAERRNGSGIRVEVREPLEAEGLVESMRTTYDKYVPNKTSVMERSMERLFGEVSKGYQDKEMMLGIGTRILGIGRVVADDGRMRIEPPDNGRTYYLTTQTKSEVLKSIRSRSTVMKWAALICGAISIGYMSYLAFKAYRRWRSRRDMARMVRELRGAEREGGPRGNDDDARTCVICLANPREVVLLDCGHICVCLACVEAIPHPRKCPMCREDIRRTIPVFVP